MSGRRFVVEAPSHAALAVMLTVVVGLAGATGAFAQESSEGPDVVPFDLFDTNNWGTSGDVTAYSVGTESCNRGTAPVNWYSGGNQHPVIAQNLYRLKDGRLEQLGMSWLKHGFASLNNSNCGSCTYPPGGGSQLGVGCSDPYWATLNGSQSSLGPHFEVNAFTGAFPTSHSTPSGPAAIAGRLQVKTSEVDPAQNAGAVYFVEGQYVAADDAQAGNGLNNASYRRVTVSGGNTLVVADSTHESSAAIYAWQDTDPSVVTIPVDVPSEGRFDVAYKVTDNLDGTWHYEYAVHNLNSDLSAGSFTVPTADAAVITNLGFHDVAYHSGEPYDGTDWTASAGSGAVTWATTSYATDPNANALRWGTTYNFWFDADQPPALGLASLGMFKPGGATSVSFGAMTPGISAAIFDDGFESGDLTAWSDVGP